MNSVILERLQSIRQGVTCQIETLEYGFQTLFCRRFNPDQCALDIGFPHGIQKLCILAGFHGYLGEEHHVAREGGQTAHQAEAFRSDGP